MAKTSKKLSTSKKRKKRTVGGDALPGVEGVIKRDPDVDSDPMVHIHGKARPDPEDGEHPSDKAAKHKYPPPSKNAIFRNKWMSFIDDICSRENFKPGHLAALEILCTLFSESHDLEKFIRIRGRTYIVVSRAGKFHKTYPEVQQLAHHRTQIQSYMKMLGLLLKKDKSDEDPGEKEEWD